MHLSRDLQKGAFFMFTLRTFLIHPDIIPSFTLFLVDLLCFRKTISLDAVTYISFLTAYGGK